MIGNDEEGCRIGALTVPSKCMDYIPAT